MHLTTVHGTKEKIAAWEFRLLQRWPQVQDKVNGDSVAKLSCSLLVIHKHRHQGCMSYCC